MRALSVSLAAAVLVLVMGAATPALAKTFAVPRSNPIATVTIPDTWETEVTAEGVSADAPDEGVYIAVEALSASEVEAGLKEGIKYLESEGVTIDAATVQQKETTINGMKAFDTTWKGKDEDGPTNVSLTLVIAKADRLLLLTFWGADAGIAANAKDIVAIAESIQPTK